MSLKTILVVEDEPSIAEVVRLYLERADYQVLPAADGAAALALLEQGFPDLIVLDLMLPEMDGMAVARWVRERSDIPIIMLTARRDEADRIRGLEMGADDYVVKPFSPQELVSLVRAVLRRAGRDQDPSAGERLLTFGGLIIDSTARTVTATGREVSLTLKEFDLLYWLARHPRQVFTRDQLLDRIWGGREFIDPGTVTVHVRRLREKIEPDPSHPCHLQTVWGMGYKFEP
jgi:DNA-binding response OmpR family regulator